MNVQPSDSLAEKVVIAIPAPLENASWRWLKGMAHVLTAGYSSHLQRAGASVLMLPVPEEIDAGVDREAASIIARVDGLVIAGGADVDPNNYHEEPAPEAGPFNQERDAWELALTRAAVDAGVPVFGICRGHQVLNVVRGGSIIQHLPPEIGGSDVHNPFKEAFGTHPVQTVEDSWVRAAIGESLEVATYHHQALDRLGEDLTVTAMTADGVIEAVEDLSRGLIGVQWHPEVREHTGVFQGFVRLCEQHKAKRQ